MSVKDEWTSEDGSVRLILGDCLDVLPTLTGVEAVVTSPPYAQQRVGQYEGVDEADYPKFTEAWFSLARSSLSDNASLLVNIRENISAGEISDYVLLTRLALRASGWIECEELIWHKPFSPPFGRVDRPRRAYERILWFAKHGSPFCDPQSNGQRSERVGIYQRTEKPHYQGGRAVTSLSSGIARCTDVVSILPDQTDIDHPAKYPVELAEWCARLVSPSGATILDPFMGSGTTGVACVRLGRKFIGIEKESKYFDIAKRRIISELNRQPLFTPIERQSELFTEGAE